MKCTPRPGCAAVYIPGLTDQDALNLWHAYGARGSREVMLPVFRRFDSHPLLIQILAYEVANFHDDPANFDAWRKTNPDFNPFELPLVQMQSHILASSLRGLTPAERRTLFVIAGLRMAASIDTIKALLIRADEEDDPEKIPFATLGELDAALTALEDRGLLGWDKRANRYDLHPIVRGVVWSGLDDDAKTDIYGTLQDHFEAMPIIDDYKKVESLKDLTPGIELYNALIGLERYDDALALFKERLSDATLYRLSANLQRIKMLKRLFPEEEELDSLPRLSQRKDQSYTLHTLAQSYVHNGQPKQAVRLCRKAVNIDQREDNLHNISFKLCTLSRAFRLIGSLHDAEVTARQALLFARDHDRSFWKGLCLIRIGVVCAARNATDEAHEALKRALRIHKKKQVEGYDTARLAQLALWTDDYAESKKLADCSWKLAEVRSFWRDLSRAARLQGTAALYLNDFDTADERLQFTLKHTRVVNLVGEELPTLVALAEWQRRRGKAERARELLDDVWEPAERVPYPMFHADALNVLAQIERDTGHTDAAIAAATEAYEKAWCDGPPFAYHWGLEKAKAHLAALHAPEPEMPPFDASQHEPMPEVEINPPDEFGGEA